MPRRTTPEPQLPSRGDLSDLDIEPPLLDQNVGGNLPYIAPTYNSGNDVPETPSRNPVLGNRDWIRQYWDQYSFQDSIDEALDPWLNQDYSHPDDDLFFSPSREISQTYDPVSINDPNAPTITGNASTPFQIPQTQGQTYGPADFFGRSVYPTWLGAFVNQYPNFPSGPIDYNQVDPGRVIVAGVDQDTGLNTGTTSAPAGPVVNQELLDSSVPLDSSSSYTSQSTAASGNRQSPPPQNIFGVGAQSGNHYYSSNGGQTWVPIGQAPQNVRWGVDNMGVPVTGNFNADQATKSYLVAGGDPGQPNLAQPDQRGYLGEDPILGQQTGLWSNVVGSRGG